ncbi:MAG: type II toxin-antitoxin system Phd/YefM family antitoxin, partial [Gemmatimonadales bacterium]
MPQDEDESKQAESAGVAGQEVEISATDARDMLGELMRRAGYGNERIVITDRGRPVAAIVGMRDLRT